MEEIWKIYCVTHPERKVPSVYEVSNYGRVKKNGKMQAPYDNGYRGKPGYFMCGSFYVHRAVAELFIPNPDNKREVDHIDTDVHNNHVSNLRWTTRSENCSNPLTIKHKQNSLHNYYSNEDNIKKASEAAKKRKRKKYTWSIEAKERHKQVMKAVHERKRNKEGQ